MVILKKLFKVTYAKHTNFGLQKFRIDYNGLRYLNTNTETKYNFKIPKYGDLLLDTYLAVKMPTIWSPIVDDGHGNIHTYEFKWIKDLGTQMIKEISITIGGQVIQKYSGDYLKCMIERDYSKDKKELFDKMSGNIDEMHSPEKKYNDIIFQYNSYPNCLYKKDSTGNPIIPNPSIEGRYIYVPINALWCMNTKMALPLMALQYTDLEIDITIRPIKELYTIINTDRDISGSYIDQQIEERDPLISQLIGEKPHVRIAPDYNNPLHQLRWFIHEPKRTTLELFNEPDMTDLEQQQWATLREDWNSDIHLISTYAFLSEDEAEIFTSSTQEYLFKDIKEHKFQSIHGTKHVELETSSLVSGWMFHFQRDDIRSRNEWSNYTNHTYNSNINNVRYLFSSMDPQLNDLSVNGIYNNLPPFWNGRNVRDVLAPLPLITNSYNAVSKKSILNTLGILMDGKYRENIFEEGIYNYLEKYRTTGSAPDGLYCYNFSINSNSGDVQPSGAINLSKLNKIEFEFSTIEPSIDSDFVVESVCARWYHWYFRKRNFI